MISHLKLLTLIECDDDSVRDFKFELTLTRRKIKKKIMRKCIVQNILCFTFWFDPIQYQFCDSNHYSHKIEQKLPLTTVSLLGHITI